VEAALLTGSGPHAPILALATSYASGQWETAIELGSRLELVDHLAPSYAEASAWARDLMVHH
jgi:c-di-GMP-related signal transduction protein